MLASERGAHSSQGQGEEKPNTMGHSQTVSYSQSVSCHSSREAACLPRNAEPTRLKGKGKKNTMGHSQTVSYSQSVSCHSSREAACLPRNAGPTRLKGKVKKNTMGHSQTVSYSQSVSCHSSREIPIPYRFVTAAPQSFKCICLGKPLVVIPAKDRHPVPRYGAGNPLAKHRDITTNWFYWSEFRLTPD